VVLLLAALVACGGAPSGASGQPGDPGGAPAAVADRTATLRYVHNSAFGILDPHRTPNYFGGQIAMRPVYDSLLTLQRAADGTVGLAPQIATDWKVADDGLSITLDLRPGSTFQDGTPLDATAVKANLDRAKGPDSTVKSLLPSLTGVDVATPTSVVLHLSRPDSSLLWALGTNTTGMMASPAAFATLATKPVGSGPYKLVSATDAEITYERWDGYPDKDAALANRLVISTVPDVNARYTGLRSGQFDVAFLASPLDAQSKALEEQGYHWRSALSPISTGILLNAKTKPFDDVRVRRAVSMAINRTQISQNLLGGMNPPAYQTFLKGYLGYDPALDKDVFDPAAAKQLIQEAGATGAAVTILHPASAPYDAIAAVVQQSLNAIGLTVTLQPVDNAQMRSKWREGTSQAAVNTNVATVDPGSTLLGSYLGGDNPAPPAPELTAMADAARTLPVGSPQQAQAYQQISTYLVDNPIHVPLVQFGAVFVAAPNVVGSDDMSLTGAVDLSFSGVGVRQ
jgi:ABC-type transport system substrate-binding protein